MDENETRIHNGVVLKELKPGDLIRFYQDYGEHWAVYAGDETVIHWWKKNTIANNPRITITSFWECADKMIAEKINSDSIDITKVMKRAKDFMQKLEQEENVGEHKAHPDLFDSCEHFAKWCHYGLGGLDKKWFPSEADSVINIDRVKNVWEFVHGIFTNHTDDGQTIRRNVEVLGQLQPGDVVRFSRGLYEHWATYIGQDKDKTIPKSVIHWWDNDGASNPYIRIVPFWELAGNCTTEKFNSDHTGNIALTESEAVSRTTHFIEETEEIKKAKSIIDEVEAFHCSEDFAKYVYLNLMSKPGTANPRDPISVGKVVWWFCKHKDVGFRNSRGALIDMLLDTLEPKISSELFDCAEEIKHQLESPELEGQTSEENFPVRFDPCSIFTRRKNYEVLRKLKPGDLIKFVEKSCNHWGVYTDHGTFIHWTAECHVTESCSTSDGCMPCIEMRNCITHNFVEKLERLNREGSYFDGYEIAGKVQAFKAKIIAGEKNGENYMDLFSDCEHFATWCHYGLGNKRLKISTKDIEQIKDLRKFVQGEFSPIPWQMNPNKGIPASQMQKLRLSKADIGKVIYMGKAESMSLPKP